MSDLPKPEYIPPLLTQTDMEAIKRLWKEAQEAVNYASEHHDLIFGDLMDAVEESKPIVERMGA